MKIIVGLGNPGSKYVGTRHNVGFEVIDYLAAAPACGPFRPKFQAEVAELNEAGEQVLLVKPQTFMNLSGRSVRQAADFYKVPPEAILVISDDFNLPLGKLRARAKGSHGGQNGLRNIQECMGTDGFPRLRVGVGEPGSGDAVDHVLSRFRPGERAAIGEAVAKAADGVLVWVRLGIEACMNRVNGPDEPRKKKVQESPGERRSSERPRADPPPGGGEG